MIDNQLFQPPPTEYTLDGHGLPSGCRVRRKDDAVFVCVDGRVPAEDRAGVAVLWLHGNASDAGYEAGACVFLSEALGGCRVLAVEYPGYGPHQEVSASPNAPPDLKKRSPSPTRKAKASPMQSRKPTASVPTEATVDAAVIAGLATLVEEDGYLQSQVVIVGRSLGTGPATRLARNLCDAGIPPRALVLWSPMSSVRGMVQQFLPYGTGWLSGLVAKRWDLVEDVSHCKCPLLLICGGADQLTPKEMTDELKASAKQCSRLMIHVNPTATHNDLWDFEEDVVMPTRELLHSIIRTDESSLALMAPPEKVVETDEPLPLEAPVEVAPICIVGAGPVGLWVAISLVEAGVAASDIVVFEKYASYRRHHVLRLEKSSLAHAPKKLVDLITPLTGVTKTSLLETALSGCATDAGIRIVRGVWIQEPSALKGAKIIIGCDGSKSVIREQLLGGEGERETLQHVLDCRLQVRDNENTPEKMNWARMLAALGHVDHIVEESVSKKQSEQGTYPATLRLLISKQEYLALREAGATLRDPITIPASEQLIPPAILKTIRTWLSIRAGHYKSEQYESITVTALDLAVYRAAHFAERQADRTTVFVCGDSAFGVPFFRALNNGLLSGTALAFAIADELKYGRATLPPIRPSCESKKVVKGGGGGQSDGAGILSSMWQSVQASTGISMRLAEISARGATEAAHDMVTPLSSERDPVVRYCEYMKRLAQREFSVARAKRDALTIVVINNQFRRMASSWTEKKK